MNTHATIKPTFDGDTRLLVSRCALRGIPAAVLDRHGVAHLVRSLDDLDDLDRLDREAR